MKIILEVGEEKVNPYSIVGFADENQYTFYNITDPDIVTLCEGCEENISNITKILAEGLEYCVACFAKLFTFHDNHYRVMNALDFVLFQQGWTAEEELTLVESIDSYGFDWERIEIQIGTMKSAKQIEQHYTEQYLSRQNSLPQLLVDHIERVFFKQQDQDDLIAQVNNFEQKSKLPEPTMNSGVRLQAQRRQFRRRRGHKFKVRHHNNQVNNSSAIIGFAPKRVQFQEQFDDEAQILLADMQFLDDDSQDLQQLKIQVIMDYNKRVALRNSIKQFVISRNIIDVKYQTQRHHQRSQSQKQIHGMMKVFSRFSAPKEHQKMVNGIAKSLELQKRIDFLKKMRRKGLKTFEEINNYEAAATTKPNDYWNVEELVGKGRTRRSLKIQNQLQSKMVHNQNGSILSQDEKQLCLKFRLSELHYIMIRQTIERHLMVKGQIRGQQLFGMFKLAPQIVQEIYNYLSRSRLSRSKQQDTSIQLSILRSDNDDSHEDKLKL